MEEKKRKEYTEWNSFEALDIRCGTVLRVEAFPEARKPALKLYIDFGDGGILKSSAQITERYAPENLVGTQVIAVINFQPRQIGKFMSECLVLGVVGEEGGVVLLRPDRTVGNGKPIA